MWAVVTKKTLPRKSHPSISKGTDLNPESNPSTDLPIEAAATVTRNGWRSKFTRGLGLVCCALLGMFAGNLWMAGNFAGLEATREVSEDDREETSRFGRFFRHRFLTYDVSEIGKNHESVKSAFEDVIRDSNRSTVRVLVRGRQVALGTTIDSKGVVLTKASELTQPNAIECQLHDGHEYPARIIAESRLSDLALLELDVPASTRLEAAQFEDSHPALGDWLAVPGGRGDEPLVVGVVSSQPREIKRQQGLLGVFLGNDRDGAVVEFVIPESSAEEHGIQAGDVVFSANGKSIRGREQLQKIVGDALPGDRVEFGIRRLDREIFRKVTLGRRSFDGLGLEPSDAGHEGGPLSRRRSGFTHVIQHDCPLRPNQCGGPLVNLDGRIIGVNIARASRIESFALPAHEVREELDRLLLQGVTAYRDADPLEP